MTEGFLLCILLSVMCVSLVTLTGVIFRMAADLRGTLTRLNSVLPEFRRSAAEARHVLVQINRIVAQAESLARRVSCAAEEVIEPLSTWTHRAQAFFSHHGENGTRSGPRRHERRGRS